MYVEGTFLTSRWVTYSCTATDCMKIFLPCRVPFFKVVVPINGAKIDHFGETNCLMLQGSSRGRKFSHVANICTGLDGVVYRDVVTIIIES